MMGADTARCEMANMAIRPLRPPKILKEYMVFAREQIERLVFV